MRSARAKIAEIFGRAALASGTVFRVICLSLAVCAAARGSAKSRDGEPKSFRIYRVAVLVYGDLCAPPSRSADNPREINEAERLGWMGGPRDQESPEISNYFSFCSFLRGGAAELIVPGRTSKIFLLASGAVFHEIYLSSAIPRDQRARL